MLHRRTFGAGALSAALAAVFAIAAAPEVNAQSRELKLAHFVIPQHPYSKFLQEWADLVAKKSGGKVTIAIFPNGQMGPAPRYYDMARSGQVDVTWFVHGFTPGRFPLTDLSNMPYLFGSGEIGTQVLNEPQIRAYLDKEHAGVRVMLLHTHQPGNIHTTSVPVRRAEDLKGLRIRFASPAVREFIGQLGGTPVGIPTPEIVEGMQKGTLDGAFVDYGGAGLAFRMGPVTKYTTEMYSYVVSFGTVINRRTWDSLGPEMQKVLDGALAEIGGAAEAGRRFDGADEPGKQAMIKAGTQIITLAPVEDAKFRKAGAEVTERVLAELESKGQPARKVYGLMQDYAAKHAKSSRSFWK